METYRYERAWQALAVAMVLFFLALPIVIVLDGDNLDIPVVVISSIFIVAGAWCYLYFRAYAVVLDREGFTVHELAKASRRFAWRDVVNIAFDENEVVISTNDGRLVKISVHFPGYAAIGAAAAANLAEASFGEAGKPYVESHTDDPVVLRERHRTRSRTWLRFSRRLLVISILLAAVGWLSEFGLRHADFSSLPDVVGTILIWILAFMNGWGYGMAAWMLLMSVLFFIMYRQEARRLRKGLPPVG